MLAALRSRPGMRVAAWHADRLTRNSEDTEELIRVCAAGGHLVVTASGGTYDLPTANGRKQFRADANDAAYEVDHGRERVLAARAEVAPGCLLPCAVRQESGPCQDAKPSPGNRAGTGPGYCLTGITPHLAPT